MSDDNNKNQKNIEQKKENKKNWGKKSLVLNQTYKLATYLLVTIENLLLNDYKRILKYIKDSFDLDYKNIDNSENFIDKNYIFKELNMLKEFEKGISLNEKLYLYIGDSFFNKKMYNISNFFFNLGALINPKEFLYKLALTTYYKEKKKRDFKTTKKS